MPLNKRDAATRNMVLVLGKSRVVIVAKELSGRWTMYGKDAGLWLTAGSGSSGVAGGDRNGYNLTFTGEQREPVLEVSSGAAATLETPGS